jgi:serine/threonine-protein kinase
VKLLAGDVVAQRYELEQLVGSGGMSSVFRAHDRVLERTVALKMLHERLTTHQDVVDRFGREAKLVAGLSHHNIVSVIDRGDDGGSPFIVFEYVAGENLKQVVVRDGPLPVERVLELGVEIARALAFAHEKGFVHRDVKPQNVLLNGKGEAKVTDFGIARPIEARDGETQTGTVLGTCDYISPEQAQGKRVDALTDEYSLGVVLYELLTGEVPFSGDNFVAIAMQHINAPPPPVSLKRPEVPARVEAAVERALAKDPAGRFPTMAAFADELEACLAEVRAGGDTGATGILPIVRRTRGPDRASTTGRRHRRRNIVVAVLAVLAAAAIATAAIIALDDPGSPARGGNGRSTTGLIRVTASAAYDPEGDGHEDNADVPLATDRNATTAWETEHYNTANFGNLKSGVGLVLDAGSSVKAKSLTIRSDTPGYPAVIKAGDSPTGPFADDSSSQIAGAATTFTLSGSRARYYLIWITNLGPSDQVSVNEVTAK